MPKSYHKSNHMEYKHNKTYINLYKTSRVKIFWKNYVNGNKRSLLLKLNELYHIKQRFLLILNSTVDLPEYLLAVIRFFGSRKHSFLRLSNFSLKSFPWTPWLFTLKTISQRHYIYLRKRMCILCMYIQTSHLIKSMHQKIIDSLWSHNLL
jgi:hypothetical protein